MQVDRTLIANPFFSICIPQYNRISFLIEACRSLIDQTFKNFEVCISDDCSTDGREKELLEFLEKSNLSFVYHKQEQNKKYDGNLRSSIELAKGKYCFLLGNDDCLAESRTLEDIHSDLQKYGKVGVVITNYEDFASSKRFRRIQKTGVLGKGPKTAAYHFRDFSFVSGVLLETPKAYEHATSKWDGSEMYQVYIGCRTIAEGASLLGIDRVAIRQGIRISREQVDSIALRPKLSPCPIVERPLPLNQLGRLVVDAIDPYVASTEKEKIIGLIFFQLLFFTYAFWIFEYRRIQSWKYAVGICWGMRPRNILQGLNLSFLGRFWISTLYGFVSLAGLIIPRKAFDALRSSLYSLAKTYYD